MAKTIEEINEKIKKGQAVVATAEEIIEIARKKGVTRAAQDVDVVTTGTFGPMCGSGAYFNMGHTKPRMKLGGGKLYLNEVPAYTGLAAVDFFLGATALPDDDPKNRVRPGEFLYGRAGCRQGHQIRRNCIRNGLLSPAEAGNIDQYQ
jgi:uncharacterized protein (DUF39 family)